MHRSRQTFAVPSALLATVALLLAAITPVLAAPTASGGSAAAPADHVTCNVSFDAEGNLLLDGAALTAAQAAVLDQVFANTDAGAALGLAADANAETCLNLAIDTDIPVSATLTGHIDICGTISWTGQGLLINDVFFEADLNNELGAFLDATGGLELCASVTVEGNAVTVDVSLETCATVTLGAGGETVIITVNDNDIELPIDSVTGAAELEAGVEVFVAVLFSGSVDLGAEADAVTLEAEILGTEGCEAVEPGMLTVMKETTPAGSAEVFAFEFLHATGGTVGEGSFELSDGESFTADDFGTYTITEVLTDAQVTAGWTVAEIACDDAGATITADGVQIVIEAGDDVTCTFENQLAAGPGGAAPTPAPTAPVTDLPDTTAGEAGTPAVSAVSALAMLLSLGTLGYVTLVRRRAR